MKILCIGGGPAGLYFAISAKRRDAGNHITVLERDAPGATYGWGVVYWDNLLDMMFRNDMESARRIRAASQLWQEQEVRLGEHSAYLPGYGYSIERSALLEILTRRAQDLGITVEHERRVERLSDVPELGGADLVVAADGAGSTIRGLHQDHFGTETELGSNRYIWLGTPKAFDRFRFAFQRTDAGWLWFHGYPTGAKTSTCIVECDERTWRRHGFDQCRVDETIKKLEKIFADQLDGERLMNRSRGTAADWMRFTQVTNKAWFHDNVVLLGDAAHTTHFTIGSGTRLAMVDAIALAQSIYDEPDLQNALRTYDKRRREALRFTQASARTSQAWFEHLDAYADQDAVEFAYSMAGRQGQQPPWNYQKHLIAQVRLVRRAHRSYLSARRWVRSRKRGEQPGRPFAG